MNKKLLKAQKSSSAAKGSASNRERKQQPLKAFPLTESQKPTPKESTTKQQPKASNAKETKAAVDSRTLTKSKQPTKMSQSVSMNTITSKTTTTAASRGQQPSKRQTSNSSSRLNVASAQSASNLSSLAADQQAAKEDIVSETPTPANVDQVNVLVDESTTAVSTPEENISAVEVTSQETQQLELHEESQGDDDDDDEANDADVIVDQEVYIVEETVITNGRQDDAESNIIKRFT